jgi:glutathione S-transferase
VPVLEEDGWVLPESAVIDEYLEERFPDPPLLPEDPGVRAAARLLVFRFDDTLGDAYYALRRDQPGAAAWLDDALRGLDAMLAVAPYLTGSRFGLADVSYLPWLLRLRALLGVPLEPYPDVSAWIERCAERPSVAAEIETVSALVS